MDKEQLDFIFSTFKKVFLWLDCRDVEALFDKMKDSICRDITECADKDFNESDVTCAIKRVLFNELDIQV